MDDLPAAPDEPRNETPPNSFSLEAKPAGKLKLALAALCDPNFNPKGLARIDVNHILFQITVWNSETRVIGHLRLRSSRLDTFYYQEPLVKNMVDLNEIFNKLAFASDDDTVSIYHVRGSTQLSFEFGNDTTEEFSVDLLEPDAEFREFPDITIACEAIMISGYLREMISETNEGGKPQRGLVKITEKYVSMTMGKTWKHHVEKIEGMKSALTGKHYIGWFQWPHVESLSKASHLERLFSICFLNDPPDSLMLRFFTREFWDLIYVKLYSTFATVASSNENLIPSAEPSPKICSFKFHLCAAAPFKAALHSLTEDTFNRPAGLGLFEVYQKGLQIVAGDSKTGVVGSIQLDTRSLANFKCLKPLEKKMVNLEQIALKLFLAKDDDLVFVHHVDGSKKISFRTGGYHHTNVMFSAELLEMDPEFKEFPDIVDVCEVSIPSEYLRKMIPLMVVNGQPQIVSVEIKNCLVHASVGQRSWLCDYDDELLGLNHHVYFEWPHPASLMWVSSLEELTLLYILDAPSNSIMVSTMVYKHGMLAFVKEQALNLQDS